MSSDRRPARLTDELVAALPAASASVVRDRSRVDEYEVFDTEVPALHVRVSVTGYKVFALHYKDAQGVTRRDILGPVAMGIDAARVAARARWMEISANARPTKVAPAYLDAFHRLGAKPGETYGAPPAKKLSLLLRPSFIANPGHELVWGDWSNIEARVLPWLAASTSAERYLDIFRTNDKDPNAPDIYIITGSALNNRDPADMWAAYKDKRHPEHKFAKDVRQAYGKVPTLSLGFGGALGALQAMAVNYGVYLDDATGIRVVKDWRAENTWARDFWGAHGRNGSYGLWGAANSAMQSPDTIHPAGRVAFVYDKSYLGGTLFMALPDGRLLSYPAIKWEWREVTDKKTGKTDDRYQLTFLKGYARSALWYGKLAENATQATAASVLRRTLRRLDGAVNPVFGPARHWMPVVMHTHDEIMTEVEAALVADARASLQFNMTQNGPWDQGLPLACEISSRWYYSKTED